MRENQSFIHVTTTSRQNLLDQKGFRIFLFAGLLLVCLVAGVAAAAATNFRGLEVEPLGTSQVATLDGHELLLVTAGEGDEAEARVLTGEVGSLRSVFEIAIHQIPSNVGLEIEASGLADGNPTVLGTLSLEKSGGVVHVTPDFAGANSYELVLWAGDELILSLPRQRGLAGQISLGLGDDPEVEWYAGHQVRLSGFSPGFGFRVGGETYHADRALFRAEDPLSPGEKITSVSWRGSNMNQLIVKDIGFELEGWPHHLAGPFHVTPTGDGLGAFNPSAGGAWSLDVGLSKASRWTQAVIADPLPDASLRFAAAANFSDGSAPAEWRIELSRRSSEPMRPTAWRVSFDQALGPSTIRILDDGSQVAILTEITGEWIFFEPADFEVGMDLSSSAQPSLSLSFIDPISIATADGAPSVTGDQIIVVPSTAPAAAALRDLSGLRISGEGQVLVGFGKLMVELEQEDTAVFACGSTVRMEVCKLSNEGDRRLEYQLFIEAPTGKNTCFEVQSPTAASSSFGNLARLPPANQSPPFRWQGCLSAGTSCQVGLRADTPPLGQGQIVSNHALSTDLTGTVITIHRNDLLPGLVTDELGECQPSGIQICDDELIFADDFECGLAKWSAVVGGV